MVHFLNTQPVLCEETFLKYLPQKKAGNHYPAHISHFCSIFSSGAGPAMRVPHCHWKQAHPAALTWRRRKVNKFPFLSRSPTPCCTIKGKTPSALFGVYLQPIPPWHNLRELRVLCVQMATAGKKSQEKAKLPISENSKSNSLDSFLPKYRIIES